VDRARRVRDRTHPYLVERGLEPAAVTDGTGALGQRRAEPVRQRAGHALEQQRPAAPEQVRQVRGAAFVQRTVAAAGYPTPPVRASGGSRP